MRKLIHRQVLDGIKWSLLSHSLGNVSLHHVATKIMSRRHDPFVSFIGNAAAAGSQRSAHMSQRMPAISLDDPIIKKYILNLLDVNEHDKAGKRLQNSKKLKELMTQRDLIVKNINSLNELKQGGKDDKELKALAEEENASYQKELAELDNKVLYNIIPRNIHESYSDVMVEISSGAGGQEAMLFANELFELYEKYASLRGWNFLIESIDKTDLGGIRSASFFINGGGAYYYMQNEIGVHRVQRVPTTSSSGTIHTSTAAVIVMPQPTEVDIKIADKDLHIETMRASGPGGQNVNKTESAVRIKHLPTGIAVECQEWQSQHRNKEVALMKLRTKLYDIEIQKQNKEIQATRQLQQGNRDRSEKIRTYNFPQNRITDHRCHVTCHNIKEIMEGGNAFHNFLDKLNEKNENLQLLQFLANIKQNVRV